MNKRKETYKSYDGDLDGEEVEGPSGSLEPASRTNRIRSR